jgi:hypothetical protein
MWGEIEARVNASTHLIEVHTRTHTYTAAAAAAAAVFTATFIFPSFVCADGSPTAQVAARAFIFPPQIAISFSVPSCACGAACSSSSIQ